jgi:hypothetical protein
VSGPDKQVLGGEGGIRTHVTVTRKHAFQACAIDRSATSPEKGTNLKHDSSQWKRDVMRS